MSTESPASAGLQAHGIMNPSRVYWNLSVPALYEEALRRGEASVAANGPLVAYTGTHTGRSPNDKFVVDEPSCHDKVWWGDVNKPISTEKFDRLYADMMAYLDGKDLFAVDAYAGADPAHRLPIRVITQFAWHNLFARHMFVAETDPAEHAKHRPEFTVIDAPYFKADPAIHGTRSDCFICLNFAKRVVIIGGTSYAGEIKKSIFTVMNYLLPQRDVMPMHCSANTDDHGDTALFFGLSGTGKTTLSSDPARRLIGDDEHGWSPQGVFNFEGGCYAKMIKLSAEAEPQIYSTTQRFGTVLENVVMDPETRILDFDADTLTENTRGAYPLSFIDNFEVTGQGQHPRNIVMLTADAFGVLPPIAKLTPQAAMYHFLSGYTARLAGTEKGVTEPKATFSTCFGAPFLPLPPNVYAKLLGERIATYQANVWLVNTGWSGGPHGVGKRMKIAHTRAMITAALTGQLNAVAYDVHPIFNLAMPTTCPGVPAEVLSPRHTWADKAAYDTQAQKLATMFTTNFKKFEDSVSADVTAAGPRG